MFVCLLNTCYLLVGIFLENLLGLIYSFLKNKIFCFVYNNFFLFGFFLYLVQKFAHPYYWPFSQWIVISCFFLLQCFFFLNTTLFFHQCCSSFSPMFSFTFFSSSTSSVFTSRKRVFFLFLSWLLIRLLFERFMAQMRLNKSEHVACFKSLKHLMRLK